MRIFILIFFLLLTAVNSDNFDQQNKLDKLFKQLAKINSSKTAAQIEKKIWLIWNEHPNNLKLTDKLEFGTELMHYGNYDYALEVFDNIIYTDPKWSEAWNKRATLFFLMKRYKSSLNDIDKVLGLEARHFGALSGQARIYIKLEEYEKAILSLKKALKFYPSFKSGELIPEIEKIIKEQII